MHLSTLVLVKGDKKPVKIMAYLNFPSSQEMPDFRATFVYLPKKPVELHTTLLIIEMKCQNKYEGLINCCSFKCIESIVFNQH